MEFDINDVAQVGSVADVPGYMLPPEAWTLALNMRYADQGIQSLDGWTQTFNTPPPFIEPHFAFPVAGNNLILWPYVSLTRAAYWNGAAHTEITRASGPYNTNDTFQWNGTMLGEVLILNNGVDQPQAWMPPYTSGPLIDLPNFTNITQANPPPGGPTVVNRTAKVIRAFGSFLIAADITENSVNHPHRVLWSHPADPSQVPKSWDVTDTTVDAGSLDLPDVAAGVITDILPLGSTMYVYKEASIWKMRFVGGQSIFDFGQSSWITTAGLLGQRCVCVTGDGTKHVLATQDDIIWHNGNNVQSILNNRQRRRLQNEIDTINFAQSFIFPNPFNNEVWFCYPSQGNTYPNRALILNYKTAGGNDFVVTEADGITFRNATMGTIEAPDSETWGDQVAATFTAGNPGKVNIVGHGFPVDQELALYVQFPGFSGAVPNGLSTGTFYYVRNPTANDFELALAPGGPSLLFSGGLPVVYVMTGGRLPVPDTWDQFTGPWAIRERRRVVALDPTNKKFYNFSAGTTRDGKVFDSVLQRTGLALIGKKRDGSPIVDHRRMKMFTRAWPKIITAATGNTINIRFGAQQTVDGPIRWGEAKTFNPANDVYADPGPATGRAVGIEYSSTGVLWRMDGYKIEMQALGEY